MEREDVRKERIAERRRRVEQRLAAQQHSDVVVADVVQDSRARAPSDSQGTAQAKACLTALHEERKQSDQALASVLAHGVARRAQHASEHDAQLAEAEESVARVAGAYQAEEESLDSAWSQLQGIGVPQELHSALLAAAELSQAALQPTEALQAALREMLNRCDEDYVALLELQQRELGDLLAAMQRSSSDFLSHQMHATSSTMEAFLQEHAELRQSYQATVAALMSDLSALEKKCVSQYLGACAEFQAELHSLGEALAEEHTKLRRRHFIGVAGLDAKLDAERASNILDADRLSYDHRVLVGVEQEHRELLIQHKRRINRHWEGVAQLKARHSAAEQSGLHAVTRLVEEISQVQKSFSHLRRKYQRLEAADLARREQVQHMQEKRLCHILGSLAAAVSSCKLLPAAESGTLLR